MRVRVVDVSGRRCAERQMAMSVGDTAADVFRRAFPEMDGDGWMFAVDGARASADSEVRPGSSRLDAWMEPGDPITGALVGLGMAKWLAAVTTYAIIAAAGTGLSYAASRLMKRDVKATRYRTQAEDLSQNYSWDYDAPNPVEAGAPIPVLYGERMVLPPVLQSHVYTDNSSGESYLTNIYGVCEAGAGFLDRVTFPTDADGSVQALVNHASWRNYVDEESALTADTDVARGLPAYTRYDTETGTGYETDKLTDGDASTKMSPGNAVFISTRHTLIRPRFTITSTYYTVPSHKSGNDTEYAGLQGFSVSGRRADGSWVRIGQTSSGVRTDASTMTCICSCSNTDRYTDYLISDFIWTRGDHYIREIEIRGTPPSLLTGADVASGATVKTGRPGSSTLTNASILTDGVINKAASVYSGGFAIVPLNTSSVIDRVEIVSMDGTDAATSSYRYSAVATFEVWGYTGEPTASTLDSGTRIFSGVDLPLEDAEGSSSPKNYSLRMATAMCLPAGMFSHVALRGLSPASGSLYETATYVKPTELRVYAGTVSDIALPSGTDIRLEVSDGAITSRPMAAAGQGVWGSLSVSKKISSGKFVFSTSANAYADKVAIHLSFPYGLYSYPEEETATGVGPLAVKIAAQIRPHGAGDDAWEDFSQELTGEGIEVSGDSQEEKNLYYERLLDGSVPCHDIRVWMPDAPAESPKKMFQLVWDSVSECHFYAPTYPRTACAGVIMRATDDNSGSAPQFKVLARRGTVMAGDGVYRRADNPAWACFDLLTGARTNADQCVFWPYAVDADGNYVLDDDGNRTYGEPQDLTLDMVVNPSLYDGEFIPTLETSFRFSPDNLLFDDFERWGELCDYYDITCSMYYDGNTTVEDAIGRLLDIGRAMLVVKGGRIGVVVDAPAIPQDDDGYPLSAEVIDDDRVIAGSLSVSLPDTTETPDAICVTYFDREREWQRSVAMSENGLSVSLVPTGFPYTARLRNVELTACDRRDVATRHIEYLVSRQRRMRTVSWQGGLESFMLEPGDHVRVRLPGGEMMYATVLTVEAEEEERFRFGAVEYIPGKISVVDVAEGLSIGVMSLESGVGWNVVATTEEMTTDGGAGADLLLSSGDKSGRYAMFEVSLPVDETSGRPSFREVVVETSSVPITRIAVEEQRTIPALSLQSTSVSSLPDADGTACFASTAIVDEALKTATMRFALYTGDYTGDSIHVRRIRMRRIG